VKLLENTTIETLPIAKSDEFPLKTYINLISFKGLVKKAQVSGQADTGCQHYLGTVLEDKIISDIRYTAKKGQKIKINIRITDFKGKSQSDEIAYTTITTLLLPKRKF